MPTSAEGETTYLDASALVKLVVTEAESPALKAHLSERSRQSSCGLSTVEVVRAVRPHGPDAVTNARTALTKIALIGVSEPLLEAAADLEGPLLRSLDAIHIAAAQSLEDDLSELITYDRRMSEAARALGISVVAPA